MDYVAQLKALPKRHEFLVGIDSDGCVFDTMEIKHKECFCPCFVKHFGLQAASKYARQVWEFVNLYSRSRGCNRFLALQQALRLAGEWPVFAQRGLQVTGFPALDAWLNEETKLGNPALAARAGRTGDPGLAKVLAWSTEANERIADLVFGVPPFPGVCKSLEKLQVTTDVMVVSQTPVAALEREWQEHRIEKLVSFIAGQEAGTKAEHIAFAAGGRYPATRILMIGDAHGDLNAARANQALFFPIVPGAEERSWQRFLGEGCERFFAGTFAGAYQQELLQEFDAALPLQPPWKT